MFLSGKPPSLARGQVRAIVLLFYERARKSHKMVPTCSPYFQLGPNSLRVSVNLHATNRKRLSERLKGKTSNGAMVFLQGGEGQCRYNTDTDIIFRQVERNFFALFHAKNLPKIS